MNNCTCFTQCTWPGLGRFDPDAVSGLRLETIDCQAELKQRLLAGDDDDELDVPCFLRKQAE
jgi:hypothetical protein